MKPWLACAGVPMLIGAAAATRSGGQGRRAEPRDRDRTAGTPLVEHPLVGAWRLVALEEPGADGTPRPVDAVGLFVFTPDGHAAVQVMHRTPSAGAAGPAPGPVNAPVQYAQGGYEATFGRYTVDERARTFTYRLDGSLVRTLVGRELVRGYEISRAGTRTRLVVRPVGPDEHWSVTWERDGAA